MRRPLANTPVDFDGRSRNNPSSVMIRPLSPLGVLSTGDENQAISVGGNVPQCKETNSIFTAISPPLVDPTNI